jgi:arylsulfatase A-like enzyme
MLAMILVASGCGGSTGRGGGTPNVLLITLDTTRLDRLGCYGHTGGTSTAIDGLANAGIRFEQAYAQVPLTLPSHASMLTGTYPGVNGLHVNGSSSLGASLPTLAESFSVNGYRTGAFVSSFVLHRVFGLARGFDHYDDDLAGSGGSSAFEIERPADEVTGVALDWLGASQDQPFFAWVHYYDAHVPYRPPQEFRSRFDDAYDGEIAFMDSQIGRLIAWLEQQDLRDDTLIVVAADHGESFDEHGEPQHGLFVYDTTVRVPLILSWPARLAAGVTVEQPVRLVDLFPTVLELMGWNTDPERSKWDCRTHRKQR